MNVIITGGGGDIGSACARLLASRGATVLVADADRARAEDVASEINEDPHNPAAAEAIAAERLIVSESTRRSEHLPLRRFSFAYHA